VINREQRLDHRGVEVVGDGDDAAAADRPRARQPVLKYRVLDRVDHERSLGILFQMDNALEGAITAAPVTVSSKSRKDISLSADTGLS